MKVPVPILFKYNHQFLELSNYLRVYINYIIMRDNKITFVFEIHTLQELGEKL